MDQRLCVENAGQPWTGRFRPASLGSLIEAVAAVSVLTVVLLPFRDMLGELNILVLFLIPCFGVALRSGAGPAIVAAVVGFLAFDFFFLPPYLTLTVAEPDHVLALFAYLAVAILTAVLAARIRERTERAERAQRRTQQLYEMNAALVGGATLDDLLAAIVERVATVVGASRCRILLPEGDRRALDAVAAYPVDSPPLAEPALQAARSALGQRMPVAPQSGPGEPHRVFFPIATANRPIGVIEVERTDGDAFDLADEALLAAFASQAALALERARLSEEAANAAALAESDQLKSSLLAAVSHDLRTPLASIKAAATSLLDDSVAWDNDARRDLLEAIDEETDRLSLMVGNLLDLSRIEGGALRPQRAWYDASELVADMAARFAHRLGDRCFSTTVEQGLPPLFFDYVGIAQVLTNLIDNALKYTPARSPLAIDATQEGRTVVFSVRDSGPGIPPEVQSRIFDTFFRIPGGQTAGGSGIGLAICKGVVEAHGGRIWVTSAPGAGATFRFALPMAPSTDAAPGTHSKASTAKSQAKPPVANPNGGSGTAFRSIG